MRSRASVAFIAALAASTALGGLSPASAQDVVIMRRVIAPPTRSATPTPTPGTVSPTPTPAPTPTPSGYYSWQVSAWSQSGTCGHLGTETRSVSCETSDGITVADSFCTGDNSGPKPISSDQVVVTSSCTYHWQAGDWTGTPSTCGASVLKRDVVCLRSDGTVAQDQLCGGGRPDSTESVSDVSGCTFSWSTSSWGQPSTSCGTATETRSVSCHRSDGAVAPDASCSGTRPDATQTVEETSGCATSWVPGAWGDPAPSCGASTRSRSVTCQRGDGTVVGDDQCQGLRPDTSEPATDYSTCTASWTPGDWSAPSTTCGSATETRSVVCMNSADVPVPDAECSGQRPDASRTTDETSSCTYEWSAGAWGQPQQACGASVESRSVICRRSDGSTASDGMCASSGAKPDATQPATDYSACTIGWSASDWSPWSTTCGQATQTRSVTCQRSDGAAEPDAQCPGAKPADSQSAYQTSGCSYQWNEGDWSAPVAACGATTENRSVTCQRSDGTPVDTSLCSQAGAMPPASQTATDYSTCTFSWSTGAWSAPTTTCGDNSETRTVSCQRSNGDAVPDAQCGSAGAKPPSSQSVTDTSGCTYSWSPSDWGPAAAACGPSSQSRTVVCRRSDGSAVDDSLCTGTKPPTSQSVDDYSSCSYQWSADAWQGTPGACGASITQSRSVYCLRSNKDHVDDSLCSSAGAKPAASQTISDYSQCTYTWIDGAYVSNAPACSASAPATRTVSCQRQDKVMVDNSYCDAGSPGAASSGTVADYSACSYSWTTGAWGPYNSTCSTNATQTRSVVCTRADGASTTVADSYCSSSGTKPPTSQTGDSETDCTGLMSNGGFESNFSGWSTGGPTAIVTSTVHSGSKAAQIGYGGNAQQTLTLTVGATYSLTYWEYSTTSNSAYIKVSVTGNGSVGTAASSSTQAWVQRIFTFTATARSTTVNVYGASASSSGKLPVVDDVVVSRIQ